MNREKGFFRRAFRNAATPLLALGLLAGAGTAVYENVKTDDIRITVTGEHKSWLNKDEGFGFTKTVYETDKGDLQNTLSPLAGKFNRSGIEDQIQVGKTYDVTVQGFSLPLLNIYPNIIRATPVQPK